MKVIRFHTSLVHLQNELFGLCQSCCFVDGKRYYGHLIVEVVEHYNISIEDVINIRSIVFRHRDIFDINVFKIFNGIKRGVTI